MRDDQTDSTDSNQRHTGHIANIIQHRGFGFINHQGTRGNKGDLFFHMSALPADAYWSEALAGQRVTYTLTTAADGKPRAVDIQLN